MSYLHNTGTFLTNPIVGEKYIELSSAAIADILLLQWMPEGTVGYSPPQIDSGKLTSSGRTVAGGLKLLRPLSTKLRWHDLAFVCSATQVQLFEFLLTNVSAVNVNDTISSVNATCALIAADKYKSIYGVSNQFLLQFSLWQT